jgi:asparagine synthase (glutamine-hydrolysing)
MSHRGPDGAGEWWSEDGRIGLGHRRLAIIDLSSNGHQPMQDVTGELWIVFNGEIYNFRDLREELTRKGYAFRSGTDTEVILAAYSEWGAACLSHLNGMFAFALYDNRTREIFLSRDRAGEKPMYYTVDRGRLRFSSELKGLMADPTLRRQIDSESLDCYLAMGFVPGGRCILDGVNKLPPAHALLFELDTGQSRVWRYWQLPEVDASASGADQSELTDELEALLVDAVGRQLVADVPVGVLLSGGVDSSLVTAIAARTANTLRTFTVRFPGYGTYDETEQARLIARHFGTAHLELDAAEITVDLLPFLARQFDEPIVDSSMIPTYLVTRLVREHCTVALGGDGGDELFGGYGHYNRLLWMDVNLGWLPRMVRLGLATAAERFLPVGFKGRNWMQGLTVDPNTGVPLIASYFDPTTRRRLRGCSRGKLVAEAIREESIPDSRDLLQRATRMDFRNYMAEDILVKVDRASMANSLEMRAPLLDYRLIEFAFRGVPSDLKATQSSRKILLKNLTSRLLPREFDRERKQGFSIPLASWLRSGPWRDYFHEVLLSSERSLFSERVVSELINGHERGRANSERLFALVLFELWRREYNVSV